MLVLLNLHSVVKVGTLLVMSILMSACSVFGVRTGTEQSEYQEIGRVGESIEIRKYSERLAAQITLQPQMSIGNYSNEAFSILADYIFGNNRNATKVAMTAPVEDNIFFEDKQIVSPNCAPSLSTRGYTMRFFLPQQYTKTTAPVPVDPKIKLIELPAATFAALRFTGARDYERVCEYKNKLLESLDTSTWRATSDPVAYYYDPPWTIPNLRRNEVVVMVEASTDKYTR